MKLAGKIAAITGGTAGMGRGIAEAFLAEGASVALFARNAEKGARVLEELGAKGFGGDRAIFVAGDVMSQQDLEGFIDHVTAHFGTLDILVNNAGGAGDLQPLVNLSDHAFDEAMKWNVYSTFWATRRALPVMIGKGHGRVINISSMEGKHGKAVLTAYSAAKHAVNGMTKSLAREVGAQGVTVNAICPGIVITDINADWFHTEGGQKQMKGFPRRRLMEAGDLDASLLMLSGPSARAITGTVITIDDGQSLPGGG
ncbi:MAG: SDR family oxidoreductase [Porphyrobacter sp.]|nr:SDR family oxidoreductase [Porphyrobacter sp.]